jgi:hypothetical protein
MKKSGWSALSKSVRESNDVCFYRHFHGPLYFYWLYGAEKLGMSTETGFRYATFITLFMGIAAIVLISAKLFPAGFMVPSLLLGWVLLLSPSSILTVNHLTPHGLYMVLSLLCLGCAAIFCKTARRCYWYLSVMAASLSFMTLEYTMFLLVALLGTVILRRKLFFTGGRKETYRFFTNSAACFFGPILLIWPSGILKMSFVKGYLFQAYMVFHRPGAFGVLSPGALWSMRIRESPAEYLLIAAVIAAIPFVIKKISFLIPLLIYSACMSFTALKNTSPLPQYYSSLFPPLYLIGIAELVCFYSRLRRLMHIGLVTCIGMAFLLNFAYFLKIAPASLQRMQYEITSLHDLRRIIADTIPVFMDRRYIPAVHYYFPRTTSIGFNPEHESPIAILENIAGALKREPTQSQQATLLWDRNDSASSELIRRTFIINNSRELFISESAAHAVGYTVSLK